MMGNRNEKEGRFLRCGLPSFGRNDRRRFPVGAGNDSKSCVRCRKGGFAPRRWKNEDSRCRKGGFAPGTGRMAAAGIYDLRQLLRGKHRSRTTTKCGCYGHG
ncbi:MAG: hypothetical protein IJ151_07955 [Bacteroidales bacterium]|nr:hypothetical protein [Bacteroidales bacterium]